MTSQTIPALPLEDIQLQVEERMENIEPLRTLGNFLEIKVHANGVIEVSGPVQSRLIKSFVIQALKDIPGIHEVEDQIVADPDLELEIAQALAMDDRTRDIPPGGIFVRSHMGVITLYGNLPPGTLLQDILDVVSSVGAVRDVQVRLHS